MVAEDVITFEGVGEGSSSKGKTVPRANLLTCTLLRTVPNPLNESNTMTLESYGVEATCNKSHRLSNTKSSQDSSWHRFASSVYVEFALDSSKLIVKACVPVALVYTK